MHKLFLLQKIKNQNPRGSMFLLLTVSLEMNVELILQQSIVYYRNNLWREQ
jgi:hypothetical protein